jgi:hypothetical protein
MNKMTLKLLASIGRIITAVIIIKILTVLIGGFGTAIGVGGMLYLHHRHCEKLRSKASE